MKVHAKHEKIQTFLKTLVIKDVLIVDDAFQANYIITGTYNKEDYHESLQGVIIPYTGHNRIDLDAMREQHLQLYVTPTRSKYVAEKAVSLMLGLMGNTIQYHRLLEEGNWSSRNNDARVPWTSIQGKKIGFVGFGRIGKLVYKLLAGFECECFTIQRGKQHDEAIRYVQNVDELVETCDVILIAAPLNKETKDMFTTRLLSQMSKKVLVNVGRGHIVNEADLYVALKEKTLRGYASDVWYNYPVGNEKMLPSNYPIHQFEHVILSNHSGGYTTNTNQEVNEDLVKTIEKLRDGDFSDALDLTILI